MRGDSVTRVARHESSRGVLRPRLPKQDTPLEDSWRATPGPVVGTDTLVLIRDVCPARSDSAHRDRNPPPIPPPIMLPPMGASFRSLPVR